MIEIDIVHNLWWIVQITGFLIGAFIIIMFMSKRVHSFWMSWALFLFAYYLGMIVRAIQEDIK